MPELWLLAPGAPGDLGRRQQQEDGEQLPERRFRQRDGHLSPADGRRDRRCSEHGGRAPADVAVSLLPPHADADGRDDCEQRGRLGVQLREAERRQDRHEQDAAADPEEAGEDAGDEVRRPSATLAVAQYAVLVVGLVMVLIGVVVMLANSHVT